MGVLDRFRLDGRIAMITGGSRGLGRAMAQALAEAGADLVLVGREESALQAAQNELSGLGRRVVIVPGDVGTPSGAEEVCEAVNGLNLPVDILVNNVGGRRIDSPTENVPLPDWQYYFDLNLTSAVVCTQNIGRGMLARGRGSVINVTSIAGPITIKGIGGRHYETAKAALTAFTKTLAADWATRGVRANAIAPGVFLTEPNRRWFGERTSFRESFEAHIPMGRLGEPDELGPAAVFLASDASSYITGTTIVVDGGFTLW